VPVCPADAKPVYYRVTAIEAQRALDHPLVYNARGVPGGNGNGTIVASHALIYVNDDDLDLNLRLRPGRKVEPLVLRAAAGDCIHVHLTNALPRIGGPVRSVEGYPDRVLDSRLSLITLATPYGKRILVNTSRQVGLHPQLLGLDINTGNGVNLG